MKKIVDDARLIYKCCYLYYVDGMGQREICDAVGISRATVSRLLRAGKETGVVKIELENPDSVLYGELERKVEQLLGLKEVLIVDELELESKADHLQHVYEEAKEKGYVPYGLVNHKAVMKRDVKKGELITYDDIELDTTTLIYKLRQEQDKIFG